jgi:hypothetical protein
MAQAAELLRSKRKTLRSNPSIEKKNSNVKVIRIPKKWEKVGH